MSIFRFKKFEVHQERSSQKIGTDGVLLGAWCSKDQNPYKILDIGAGTGLISLMLAQRFSRADIEAIEIDDDAFEEATLNFENSPWADRMFCYHASFQEFYEQEDEDLDRYDLIVSNPPFFTGTPDPELTGQARSIARFEDALPFEELIYGIYKLLEIDGVFACIIPADREDEFKKIAAHFQLKNSRATYIKGTMDSKVKRCLLEFRFRESENLPKNLVANTLILEKKRHLYTKDAQELLKDFYLKL
ncbi:MAG: methyltransferase [Nonlabens sp.]